MEMQFLLNGVHSTANPSIVGKISCTVDPFYTGVLIRIQPGFTTSGNLDCTGVCRIFASAKQKAQALLTDHCTHKLIDMPNKECFALFGILILVTKILQSLIDSTHIYWWIGKRLELSGLELSCKCSLRYKPGSVSHRSCLHGRWSISNLRRWTRHRSGHRGWTTIKKLDHNQTIQTHSNAPDNFSRTLGSVFAWLGPGN